MEENRQVIEPLINKIAKMIDKEKQYGVNNNTSEKRNILTKNYRVYPYAHCAADKGFDVKLAADGRRCNLLDNFREV